LVEKVALLTGNARSVIKRERPQKGALDRTDRLAGDATAELGPGHIVRHLDVVSNAVNVYLNHEKESPLRLALHHSGPRPAAFKLTVFKCRRLG
jgi:hypothetical protein